MFERSTSFDQSGWNTTLDRIWYHFFLVKINLSSNTAALIPPASTASAKLFSGWPKRFLGRRCFSLQAHDFLVKFQKNFGQKLHPSKSTKVGKHTDKYPLFGIFVFLFQKQGRNSVNGWLVSQVGSWVYLPKETMMNKSMSLWGNAMCDVGGRGCICNICCKMWDVESQLVLAQFLNQQ